jgi:hypothetical protein
MSPPDLEAVVAGSVRATEMAGHWREAAHRIGKGATEAREEGYGFEHSPG